MVGMFQYFQTVITPSSLQSARFCLNFTTQYQTSPISLLQKNSKVVFFVIISDHVNINILNNSFLYFVKISTNENWLWSEMELLWGGGAKTNPNYWKLNFIAAMKTNLERVKINL